jgi:hypothetical protein
MMSRRIYEDMANMFDTARYLTETEGERLVVRDLVAGFANLAASDNHNFKRDRFYRAAGFPELASN